MEIVLFIVFLFLLGLIVGSFLNVLTLRLPRGETILGRSRCPKCKTTLQASDLVPLFSFLMLRGKCRYCQVGIPYRYPLFELVTGLLFVSVGFSFFPTNLEGVLHLALLLIVASLAVVVFAVDIEHYLILDTVIIASSVLLVLVLALSDFISRGLFILNIDSLLLNGVFGAISGVLFFGGIWLFSGGRWMGLGDVKFMIPFGLALGFPVTLVGIFLAFMLGAVVSMPLLLSGTRTLTAKIPFGTFLSVSMIITLLLGRSILAWYLRLIGIHSG